MDARRNMFPWKVLIKAAIFFNCQNYEFSFQHFYNKYKASTVKTYASSFLRGIHRICLKGEIRNPLFSWFSLFKSVAVAVPDKKDAPLFKKYVTAESNFFQIHSNFFQKLQKLEFWISGTLHHICSWPPRAYIYRSILQVFWAPNQNLEYIIPIITRQKIRIV